MQTSISSVFKSKKRNSIHTLQDKEKSRLNSKDNSQIKCFNEKNNITSDKRKKRKIGSNESFEIPENKVNNKKAKIENSPVRKKNENIFYFFNYSAHLIGSIAFHPLILFLT